ncbi:Transition state regulatory protein AbrB [bioreactor metagenome]|uniref:Transition state regulatory protein AbrB n=1 Tax=bioreactor metagenome TaxID=1076179 RepID=A0A645ITD0_9ZZZZ
MKSIGIVRKIDELGRIVLPIELRKQFDINEPGSALEIFVDDDKIILKKYAPTCIFCNSASNLIELGGHKVCEKCIGTLNDIKTVTNL